jgi:predicted CopG family antitoxin
MNKYFNKSKGKKSDKHIIISYSNYEKLKLLGREGDSWNDLVTRLLNYVEHSQSIDYLGGFKHD